MLEITISGVDGLRSSLTRFPNAVEPALRQTGDDIFDRIWQAADRHTKTGRMARSLKNSYRKGEYRIWHDLQHAPHALFVHWGSKPHEIRPKAGGTYKSYKDMSGKLQRKGIPKGGRARTALRFVVGGKFVFARWVKHPGYKGDPYFETEGSEDKVFAAFTKHFQEAIA